MNLRSTIITASVVAGVVVVALVAARLLATRAGEQVGVLIRRLVPVVVLTAVVIGILVILDPAQAQTLLDATIRYVPSVLVAVLVIIVARSAGQILGIFAETALRRVSPVVASRVSLALSSVVLAVGVLIALDQLGVSTNILLLLVAALAFGTALAAALAVGLGSLPVARQVAAGRYVQERFRPGQLLRVGGFEGRLISVGLSSSRLEGPGGTFYEVPNEAFLATGVAILPD